MAYGRMVSSIVHDVKTVSEVASKETCTAPSICTSSIIYLMRLAFVAAKLKCPVSGKLECHTPRVRLTSGRLQMGLIAMSERDLQRIEVLSKVVDGHMTVVAAAHVLAICARHVQRLICRKEATGAASIRHKAIGRPSNNLIATGVRDYVL